MKHDKSRQNATLDGWAHPTGGAPEAVLLVALGPSKHNLLEDTTKHMPDPRIMGADEVWGLNGGVNWFAGRVAFDLLWVMDHLDGEAAKEPRYMDYVAAWARRFGHPIITSQMGTWALKQQLISQVHEYPLDRIERFYGVKRPYFHNSIPYIVAYAGALGVKRLMIYGADYSHEALKGREEDRPCAEYWIGRAEQVGLDVMVSSASTLCNANRGVWYYGYRETPQRLGDGQAEAA